MSDRPETPEVPGVRGTGGSDPGTRTPEPGGSGTDGGRHAGTGTPSLPGAPPGPAGEVVVAQSVWPSAPDGGAAIPGYGGGSWGTWSDPGSLWVPGPPRRPGVGAAVLALLLVVALVAGIGIGRSLPGSAPAQGLSGSSGSPGAGASGPTGTTAPGSSGNGSSGHRSTTGSAAAPPGAAEVASAAASVMGSVVDLDSSLGYEGLVAAGTGIVIGSRGIVLTNNHVIDGETSLSAFDPVTGRHYLGVVLGYDVAADVAVVALSGASGLPVAATAPKGAQVGEQVVAVGNAGGKGGRPTAAGGNVTGLDRSVVATDRAEGTTEHLSGLIVTDARVQLGDSGGPLVDAAGAVVGMDTAAAEGSVSSPTEQGFAIPITAALAVARRIVARRASGAIHVGPTPFLGVRAAGSVCAAGSGHDAIPSGSGALVCEVIPGSAAAASGLTPGDVITSVSGLRVRGPAALSQVLASGLRPGEVVSVGYEPSGTGSAARTVRVTLGSGPPA